MASERNVIFATILRIAAAVDGRVATSAIGCDDTPLKAHGFTSLTHIELVTRLEDTFHIRISDSEALAATSALRLVELVQKKTAAVPDLRRSPTSNLYARIRERALERGDAPGFRFLGFDTDDTSIPFGRLLRMSATLARELPDRRAEGARTVVIAATSPLHTLLAFFAALADGSRPLILPGPTALGGAGPFLQRLEQVLSRFPGAQFPGAHLPSGGEHSGAPHDVVLAVEEGLVPPGCPLPDVATTVLPTDVTAYRPATGDLPAPDGDGSDVAFLQMTSASTGDGKIVAVSHANATANLTAIGAALGVGPDDRMTTWLPLYHDMGLVGTALLSAFWGFPVYMMKPSEFIMRPHRWIDALSRFRCTLTVAPNFGYDYAGRLVRDRDITDCDLSSLTRAVVGAEPIRLTTLETFTTRFRANGFQAKSLLCSYGMAESTLCTTMAPLRTAPAYVVVDPVGSAVGGQVRVMDEGVVGAEAAVPDTGVAVFSVGVVLDELDMSLVDDDGTVIDDDCVLGEVVLRGPSVSVGYLDPERGEPAPFPSAGLRTGDLAFVRRGELFVLERRKNVIVRQGQNFLASLLEERVANILDQPAHEVMVLENDILDPDSPISALLENVPRYSSINQFQASALRGLDLPIDVLIMARKRIIPRTTSGKKKYEQARRHLAEQSLAVDQVVPLAGAGTSTTW